MGRSARAISAGRRICPSRIDPPRSTSFPKLPGDLTRAPRSRDPFAEGNACHASNAGGPLETPTLSRQSQNYLAEQLHGFKTGDRRNDIYTRMRSIASKLTDQEIEALAAFYATTSSD
jgi:cytochrome c553